jgi:hypothetical protein
MKRLRTALVILFGLFLTGCAAHNALEPVGKGKTVLRGGVGGPIVAAFGTNVPVPYAVVGIQRGVSDRVNVTADLHITPMFYQMVGGEFGAVWFPRLPLSLRRTVGVGGRMLVLGSFKAGVAERFRVYPILAISSARTGMRNTPYAGVDLTLLPHQPDYDEEPGRAIASPFLGVRWNVGRGYLLSTELKWHGANIRSDQTAVEYVQIGRSGAIATLFSLERQW